MIQLHVGYLSINLWKELGGGYQWLRVTAVTLSGDVLLSYAEIAYPNSLLQFGVLLVLEIDVIAASAEQKTGLRRR
jgi:hypothetical protein